MDGYPVGGVENWLKLLCSEYSNLTSMVWLVRSAVSQKSMMIPKADIVQYLHLWHEESEYILSNDFTEIRRENNMPINIVSIQTLLRTWGPGQEKTHEVQIRQIQGFHTDLSQFSPAPVPREVPDYQGWGCPSVPVSPCFCLGWGQSQAARSCPSSPLAASGPCCSLSFAPQMG